MSYTLEERSGNLYAKKAWRDDTVPVEVTNWYLLATPWRRFRSWFASEEAARAFLGKEMHPTGNPPMVFQIQQGWRIHRANAGKPEIIETRDIPEPAHTRRQHLVWHKGAWHKETAKGLVKFAVQEVRV